MINIVICEDEKQTIKTMKTLITKWAKTSKIAVHFAEFYDGKTLLEANPLMDLVLMDMKLAEGDEGHIIAHQIREENNLVPIVFTTSYSHYMREAFDVHAFDYLEKPVTQQRMNKLMNDYMDHANKMAEPPICFKTRKGIINESASNILFFKRKDRYVYLVTAEDSIRLSYHSLDEVKALLPERLFAQNHRSYLSNLNNVQQILANTIVMSNGQELSLSRGRAESFNRAFFDMIQSN